MVSAARNIVVNNPAIEKVVILDRTPRFDLISADPSQLKSNLSEYGNKVLRDMLETCDKASHDVPTELQQNIYGHPDRRGYEGEEDRVGAINTYQEESSWKKEEV